MSEKKQKDPFRMKIIISPAKKMNVDTDSLTAGISPYFLPVPSGFCPPF